MRFSKTMLALFAAISLAFSSVGFADKSDAKGKQKIEKHEKYKNGSNKGKSARDDQDKDSPPDEADDEAGLNTSERDALADLILEHEYGFTKNASPDGASQAKKQKQLPPGLQKKLARGGSLPPGWEMKLVRGEVLDRDIYDQAERLPDELLKRITGRDDAVELLRVGDRILRVAEGRGTILDVIDLTDRALGLME